MTMKRMSERTHELQCAVIDEFRRVAVVDDAERILWRELLRAQTGLANNSAESDGTQSRRDFILKFHICLKEGRESLQLLRALMHACPHRRPKLELLFRRCDEIVSILVASLKTAKRNDTKDHRKRKRRQPPLDE